MVRRSYLAAAAALYLAHTTLLSAVKVKVVMHSEQDDSKIDEEESGASARPDVLERRKRVDSATLLPFLRAHHDYAHPASTAPADLPRSVEERASPPVDRSHPPLHPNDMLFPLIYRQSHINSMFKFGENWYTWSTEKRPDGSRALNYYICYDEPKRCDDVGWERTDSVPKCAFEIDSVMPDDRACLNTFGVEPRTGASPAALCDGADQMKVGEIARSCGPRIRSLWRFVRVGRRPPAAAKPADVNSLVCEDEEECFLTVEYRIHHDRITFSLHEPARGQTFKSVLKRERPVEGATEARREAHSARGVSSVGAGRRGRHEGTVGRGREEGRSANAIPAHAEGKGVLKERNDSGYGARRIKNKIKVRDDVSDNFSSDN